MKDLESWVSTFLTSRAGEEAVVSTIAAARRDDADYREWRRLLDRVGVVVRPMVRQDEGLLSRECCG